MELCELTATKLLKMLQERKCSAVEILKSVMEKIDKKEDQVGAFITITREDALNSARLVDEKLASGKRVGTLAGIPIALKDNICTKGVLTTAASKILENFAPPYDATVVKCLDESDAVVVGKTNLDEFAMGASCENSALKLTRNPHNLEHVPGGSSGGSVAAVAANETILALGSDTGGSVRVPASFCGVVGLRPTYGRISRYGMIPLASSLDQIGPLAKTVEDARLLYEALKGPDPKDLTTLSGTKDRAVKLDIKKLKIGVPKEYFNEHIDSEVSDSVWKMIGALEQSGAQVIEVSTPHMEYLIPVYYVILTIEAASNLARHDGVRFGFRAKDFETIDQMYEMTRELGFGEEVKRRVMMGTFLSSSKFGSYYLDRAISAKNKIKQIYEKAFKQCDIMITPTASTTAFKIGEVCDPLKMHAADLCTIGASVAALPAISIPCGMGRANLPIGAQLIGPSCAENLLFAVGEFYERNCRGEG